MHEKISDERKFPAYGPSVPEGNKFELKKRINFVSRRELIEIILI